MVRPFVLIAMLITLLACNVSPAEPTTPATPRPVVIPTSELATLSAAEFEQKLRAAGYSDEAVNRALTGFNARREQATSILSHRQVFEAVDREVRNADPSIVCASVDGWTTRVTDAHDGGQQVGNDVLVADAQRLLRLLADLQASC